MNYLIYYLYFKNLLCKILLKCMQYFGNFSCLTFFKYVITFI